MESKRERAERISQIVEANIVDLLDKLCDGEPDCVRDVAWGMLATRIAFRSGRGECFVLPPLDDC